MLADGGGRLVHHGVLRRTAILERQIEAREVEREPGDVGREHAQRLLEELLSCLVAFQDDDRVPVHRARFYVRVGTNNGNEYRSGMVISIQYFPFG